MRQVLDIAFKSSGQRSHDSAAWREWHGEGGLALPCTPAATARGRAFCDRALPQPVGGTSESELFGHVRGAFDRSHSGHAGASECSRRGHVISRRDRRLAAGLAAEVAPPASGKSSQCVGNEDAGFQGPGSRLRTARSKRKWRPAAFAGIDSIDSNAFEITLPASPTPRRYLADGKPSAGLFFPSESPSRSRLLAPEASAAIQGYRWPGNLRELRMLSSGRSYWASSDTVVCRPSSCAGRSASAGFASR